MPYSTFSTRTLAHCNHWSRSGIRQLTDVSRCNLQQNLPCNSPNNEFATGTPAGHRLRGSSRQDGAGRCGSLPPAAGTNKTSPPSVASRTAENRSPEMRGMHRSGEQSGRPRNGTKRARIGKASGSADRSFGPDAVRHMSVTIATPCPTAAHDDTRRDQKETARRAAFPQRAGRFRRWWQVLGSNQRRLSRRFYSVPLLSTPHSR